MLYSNKLSLTTCFTSQHQVACEIPSPGPTGYFLPANTPKNPHTMLCSTLQS
jgi:hypothetical protein